MLKYYLFKYEQISEIISKKEESISKFKFCIILRNKM